ncbi:hypothetical protein KZ483_05690 [Paenibacillus sp. sptzw28]|uniref:hypothetical protein n=1 Tax=Paenibacillus sp. sptzw28 TaxID=715179 RepID=UPI001C6E57CC|nr:hypothetical protein [Paenibacillus sp. sptzw28]QYR22467.1 hypothetical protein KZ483_05690 [Paenibacillus sp. sptzw28]
MITAIIIGCEIAFWLFVLAGLIFRYLFRRKRIGTLLLFCTPLIDLILLVVTFISLRAGTEATYAHALAAVYIGVSIGYGHRMIRWADVRFAHWFAHGPAPERKYGMEHARHERNGWYLHLLSWVIGCAILYGIILMIDLGSQTEILLQTIRIWSLILSIDFFISFSYSFWPRKRKYTA